MKTFSLSLETEFFASSAGDNRTLLTPLAIRPTRRWLLGKISRFPFEYFACASKSSLFHRKIWQANWVWNTLRRRWRSGFITKRGMTDDQRVSWALNQRELVCVFGDCPFRLHFEFRVPQKILPSPSIMNHVVVRLESEKCLHKDFCCQTENEQSLWDSNPRRFHKSNEHVTVFSTGDEQCKRFFEL